MQLISSVRVESAILLHLEVALVYPQLIKWNFVQYTSTTGQQGVKLQLPHPRVIFHVWQLPHSKASAPQSHKRVPWIRDNLSCSHFEPENTQKYVYSKKYLLHERSNLKFRHAFASQQDHLNCPDKFLKSELHNSMKSKIQDCACTLADIISKVDMLVAPGDSIDEPKKYLENALLAQCLRGVNRISLPLNRLVVVLQRLAPLIAETIHSILEQDPSTREMQSIQSSNLEESKDQLPSIEQISEFYTKQFSQLADGIKFEEIQEISRAVSDQVREYIHNLHQAAIAGVYITQLNPHHGRFTHWQWQDMDIIIDCQILLFGRQTDLFCLWNLMTSLSHKPQQNWKLSIINFLSQVHSAYLKTRLLRMQSYLMSMMLWCKSMHIASDITV